MKIGLFIRRAGREGAICAFDLVRYVRTLGHAMSLYSPELDPASDASLWLPFPGTDWNDRTWWGTQSLDLAIFYGIGAFPAQTLRAARMSGATVVVEADTDGRISPAQDPFGRLAAQWDPRHPLKMRLRSLKAGLDAWLWRREQVERELLGFLSEADFIKVESSEPAEILRRFLRGKQRPELADRLVEIPFAVRECFTEAPLPPEKSDTILMAGRLTDLQKGPRETVRTLRGLLRQDASVHVELHVRGGMTPEFAAVARTSSRLSVFEDTTREELAGRLRRAAVLFSRSRWETTPVIALEALCSGCTLVAPTGLPGYRSLIEGGRFGQTYERTSDRAAVEGILAELNRWRAGARDVAAVARHWRQLASLEVVVPRLLELRGRCKPLAGRAIT